MWAVQYLQQSDSQGWNYRKTKTKLRETSSVKWTTIFVWMAGPWFNIKMSSYQYRKSHCGDKTILRPSYLHNGISYTGKTTSLYWIRPLVCQKSGYSGEVRHSGKIFITAKPLIKVHQIPKLIYLVLQFFLPYTLNPGVKSRMKI